MFGIAFAQAALSQALQDELVPEGAVEDVPDDEPHHVYPMLTPTPASKTKVQFDDNIEYQDIFHPTIQKGT